MALNFQNTTDQVDLGSPVSLDNLNTGTILAWVNPDTVAPSVRSTIAYKQDDIDPGWSIFRLQNTTARLHFVRNRATTSLLVTESATSVTAGAWNFVGVAFSTAGVDTDQKLFHGLLSANVTEVGGYSTQRVGGGTVGSDAPGNLIVGNRKSSVSPRWPFDGKIAWLGIWNRVLSLGEIRAQQFHPHANNGCALFLHLGWHGIGTQPDLSGNKNNATVTGATRSAHVPLPWPLLRSAG